MHAAARNVLPGVKDQHEHSKESVRSDLDGGDLQMLVYKGVCVASQSGCWKFAVWDKAGGL